MPMNPKTENDDCLTIKAFANENDTSLSTLYSYIDETNISERRRKPNGSYVYSRTYLETMYRNARLKGRRSVQTTYPAMRTKPIGLGFAGYSATSHGNIIDDKTGKRIKPYTNNKGYQLVRLRRLNERCYVSRLVLIAFFGPPPTKTHEADHLNGIKKNNHIENLQWVTPEENIRRREKRQNVHPNTPYKYIPDELNIIYRAQVCGMTYSEFIKKRSEFEGRISRSTYDRKRKELHSHYGNEGLSEWSDIPVKTRLEMGWRCLFDDSPILSVVVHVEGNKFYVNGMGVADRIHVTWGDVLLIMSWSYRMGWRDIHDNLHDEGSLRTGHAKLSREELQIARDQMFADMNAALKHDYVCMKSGEFVRVSCPMHKQILKGEDPFADMPDHSEVESKAA